LQPAPAEHARNANPIFGPVRFDFESGDSAQAVTHVGMPRAIILYRRLRHIAFQCLAISCRKAAEVHTADFFFALDDQMQISPADRRFVQLSPECR